MQITRQTEYAIHTLLELSRVPFGELLQTKAISERQGIPEDFLKKTIQILARAGLVQTQRGTQGGVRLARPSSQITLGDVIAAIEGPLAINVCLAYGNQCPDKGTCQVHRILQGAQKALVDELNRRTFADIVEMERSAEQAPH
ncbi:MAG: Rrf2 family transcriptional regulator [Desulforudis sp.]|nr:Rrf2 family transcriptional regulator [Clostridia bacterium]RJX22548.1 MAG: Rrf2 family transcriptional regulator [Desulforudis sp.]